ncbi:MAG: Do family serine endopeptidase [Betaproteobacteria bacterium]|nr:Do family serine endopeptidase [Betaproteobacteria bacterium]
MRKLWLVFAQSATISLGVLLAIGVLKPGLIPWRHPVVVIRQADPAPVAPATASYRDAAAKARRSVVNIFTSKEIRAPASPFGNDPLFRYFFGERFAPTRPERVASLGSGVIVSPDGYILTNNHVVAAADEIQVALDDGRTVPGKIVGTDPDTDLAVIKVDLTRLPAITFGDSSRARVGDVVLAIGNPFGVGQTVTMGIISALGRNNLGIDTFENFIQTDAAINPGNSGGALVDTNGDLLGINSAIYSQSGGSLGIGFAIPVSIARQVMQQIIEHGRVIRGWIGVEVQDITPDLADAFKLASTNGSLIAGVLRGGPADHAGIRPGDILVAVNGHPVRDAEGMLNQVAALTPGARAVLTIMRHGKPHRISLTVGRRPRAADVQPDANRPGQ